MISTPLNIGKAISHNPLHSLQNTHKEVRIGLWEANSLFDTCHLKYEIMEVTA
tara:strand:- start:465 stop:623 length:159 start_codon:yes stop_codon:yes gene_type:complete